MASKKQRKAAATPKTAATTRTTRATRSKSKEVQQPPPIAPSRRSTRAHSVEQELQAVEDPNKILRRRRKTPDVQAAPVQPKEATPEPEVELEVESQDAPASTPVIIETKEVEEYDMQNAPSSPTPAAFKVETQMEVEVDINVESEIGVQQQSSPFDALPAANRSPSPIIEEAEELEEVDDEEASVYSGYQSAGHQNGPLSPIVEETASEIAHFLSPRPLTPLSVKNRQLNQVGNNGGNNNCNGSGFRFTTYHNLFSNILTLLAEGQHDKVRQIVEERRDAEIQRMANSPSATANRNATPTDSEFLSPSQEQAKPRAGFLSTIASPFRAIATPVSRMARLFSRDGAKTQPVQKTTAAPALKAPSTPTGLKSHSSNTASNALYPSIEQFLPRDDEQVTPSYSHSARRDRDATATPSFDPSQYDLAETPDIQTLIPGYRITHLPDGRPIPVHLRSWYGGKRLKQQEAMNTVHTRDAEVASGHRVLTEEERRFRSTTLFYEDCLNHWRIRQAGNRRQLADDQKAATSHTTTPLAGTKRGAEDVLETTETHQPMQPAPPPHSDTPSKRRRIMTPVGYNSPVPGEPEYRHVNEERGTAAANAPGSSEPSERTRGGSFAVPDDSGDEDMLDTTPAATPAAAPTSPGKTFGLPDNFYDSDSDEDDVTMDAPSELPPTTPAVAEPVAADVSSLAAPPTTPYAHKYTPHKPSGLRAMETISSPAVPVAELTPPHSPEVAPYFMQVASEYVAANAPARPFSFGDYPELDVSALVAEVSGAYKEMLCERNGIAMV